MHPDSEVALRIRAQLHGHRIIEVGWSLRSGSSLPRNPPPMASQSTSSQYLIECLRGAGFDGDGGVEDGRPRVITHQGFDRV
jgi:hypothetical protein